MKKIQFPKLNLKKKEQSAGGATVRHPEAAVHPGVTAVQAASADDETGKKRGKKAFFVLGDYKGIKIVRQFGERLKEKHPDLVNVINVFFGDLPTPQDLVRRAKKIKIDPTEIKFALLHPVQYRREKAAERPQTPEVIARAMEQAKAEQRAEAEGKNISRFKRIWDWLAPKLLSVAFVAGLLVISYPSFANFVNSRTQSAAINSFNKALENITPEELQEYWEEADLYNQKLSENSFNFGLTPEETEAYYQIFDPTGTGIMGQVEIPLINVSLPVYHGVEEKVLQIAVGHIPGSSLPAGGSSTHSVLSGHRGLPSTKLFTDLDKLAAGDIFILHVLDRTMAYEVDQIRIVLPSELEELAIHVGKDYSTLVTCTPYAINSHRLLIRGKRVDYEAERQMTIPADLMLVEPINIAPIMSVAILLVLFFYYMFFSGTERARLQKANQEKLSHRKTKEAVLAAMLHKK